MSGQVRRLRPAFAVNLRRTLRAIGHAGLDPTVRFAGDVGHVGLRTPDGAARLVLRPVDPEIEATAWGPGAAWALDHADDIAGCNDRDDGFAPVGPDGDRRVADWWLRFRDARLPRTGLVAQAVLAMIPGQRVRTEDAARSYQAMVRAWGEPAPGPEEPRVWVPPAAADVAAQPYYAFHPFGIERRRAEIMRRVAASASRLDALAAPGVDPAEARHRLQVLPGVGAWTANSAAMFALGDADAVPVGDLHFKRMVCWALAHDPDGTDDKMLELLAPYIPHRARVLRLIMLAGVNRPSRPRRWG
jgi:3-methyladenine DNA glycosylase/8-oxoguanine DNA glycosylase